MTLQNRLGNRCDKTVHFSVDDTIWLFQNLEYYQYDSVFEQPLLGFFNELHDQFNITVSFYCFGEFQGQQLDTVTDRYCSELTANSKWLKFGFHAANDTIRYMNCTPEQAQRDYIQVLGELKRIAGEQALDYVSRIHAYSGSKEALVAMSRVGLKGLLCGNGTSQKDAYFLDSRQKRILLSKGHYNVFCNGLHFWMTAICAEKDEHACETIEEYLQQQRHVEIFTHEWAIDDAMRKKIISYCWACKKHGYRWNFL